VRFNELVACKEAVSRDIYFNDKVDLLVEGSSYQFILRELLLEIQKLSQRLSHTNNGKGFNDSNGRIIVACKVDPISP
jgi:hypothetical protein